MNSITREQAKERLLAEWGHLNALTDSTLDILFPTQCIQKEGEDRATENG